MSTTKPILGILLTIATVLTLVSCTNKPDNKPILVGQSTADSSHLAIQIWMVEGSEEKLPDSSIRQLSGTFELVLLDSNQVESARTSLNDIFRAETLNFDIQEPFTILTDDYNRDQQMDFVIGQAQDSNGSIYALLTAGADKFERLTHELIYSADKSYSIQFEKRNDNSFYNSYYDQEQGKYMQVHYQWSHDIFEPQTPEALEQD